MSAHPSPSSFGVPQTRHGAPGALFREDAPGAWGLLGDWVPYVLATRLRALIDLRWMRFPAAGQATLVASLLAKRSLPTPLVWRTVDAAALERKRPAVEAAVLARLREVVPPALKVVLLAAEAFSEPRILRQLEALGLDYVVRVAPDTEVFHATEGRRPAAAWTPESMRPGRVLGVRLTSEQVPVAALVCAKKGALHTPWCLATSLRSTPAKTVLDFAARLGGPAPELLSPEWLHRMGLAPAGPHPPGQRDRLVLLGALIAELLTVLGAVGGSLGLSRPDAGPPPDRGGRTLFQQGCIYYQALPLMPGAHARQLVAALQRHLDDKPAFRVLLAAL